MSDDLMRRAVDMLVASGKALYDIRDEIRCRQIIGGVFGVAGFHLASWPMVSHGIDEVRYFVVHTDTGAVFAMAKSKPEALSTAREILCEAKRSLLAAALSRAGVQLRELIEQEAAQREAAQAEWRALRTPPRPRTIPKRRRDVFEASGGKCHYCGVVLTLDGKWHIEHKVPRALFGGSEQSNLAASCVPCNLKKSDATDLEFIAKQGGRAAMSQAPKRNA